jgi:glyoxylase-like metal-dependent hydrolase (beta-lactamase superfamily II)
MRFRNRAIPLVVLVLALAVSIPFTAAQVSGVSVDGARALFVFSQTSGLAYTQATGTPVVVNISGEDAAFAALGITPADVTQIVLTHAHPDHYGMAGWLQQQTGAPVRLSAREALFAQTVWQEGGMGKGFDHYLIQLGMPDDEARTVARGVASTGEMTFPHPTTLDIIQAGDEIQMGKRRFRMIHAPGHSDGQLMFYDAADRLLLCGDHVLMKITPNIGLWPESDPNPLGRFLVSLQEFKALDVRLALPGHKSLITDWRGRLAELLLHHEARLLHTLAAVEEGHANVYDAARAVFNSSTFTPHEWRFAMAETLAHLDYLERRGLVRRQEDEVWSYRPV